MLSPLPQRWYSPSGIRFILYLVCSSLIVLSSSACASQPKAGVRTQFQHATVDSIAIFPFYSSYGFSLTKDELQALYGAYEDAAYRWLTEMGYQVIDSRAFRHHLVELGVWNEFIDGMALRRSLIYYFENASLNSPLPVEVLTLRQFAERGVLPAASLLFGQIIYQSHGLCRVAAHDEDAHTELILQNHDNALELPTPCVISHFEAKLVDAKTGQTMWYNRLLREIHQHTITPEHIQTNIDNTVIETLGNTRGIAHLPPRSDGDEHVVGEK